MNIIAQLRDEVANLKSRVELLESQAQLAKSAKKRVDGRKTEGRDDERFPIRFTDEVKDMILTAWEMLSENRNLKENPITHTEWQTTVHEMDVEPKQVPSLVPFGPSMRALLCEAHGLHVTWARRTAERGSPRTANGKPSKFGS